MLEFERPIKELEDRIAELQRLAGKKSGLKGEISQLERSLEEAKERIYRNLTPYQRVQVARHQERPGFHAYCDALVEDFYELAGDRLYGDDPAIRGGLARIAGYNVVLIGNDKGTDVKSRVASNFGMAHPEGYRKVGRMYDLAGRFSLPVVALVDTPGAFAGKGAEERGQAWAISEDLLDLVRLPVPVLSVVVGEGGSGGALAMCIADYVGMLENSYLSVISPEGCASILFRDSGKVAEAAEALKLTAHDLEAHGITDEVIEEPLGGAHRDPQSTVEAVGGALERALSESSGRNPEALLKERRERYRRIGAHVAEAGG